MTPAESNNEEVLAARFKKSRCHFATIISRGTVDCVEFAKFRNQSHSQQQAKKTKSGAAFKVKISPESDSDESVGLVVQHAPDRYGLSLVGTVSLLVFHKAKTASYTKVASEI